MDMMASAAAAPAETGGCHRHQRPEKVAAANLHWIKSFETGSAEIDAMHRELVEECNSLLLAVEAGAAWSRIVADSGKLVEGCIQHFRHEEELLDSARFPRHSEHVAEHRRTERDLHALISRMTAVDGSLEEHRAYPRALGPMLVDVIIRHDLDYRSHLMHVQGR
ncbi:MAG TPA: hemerythrin domain-containing protein [Dongiaceae bacterium]|nr:hemerythrin domain-containing protein [Dongiaceae bacterium]